MTYNSNRPLAIDSLSW